MRKTIRGPKVTWIDIKNPIPEDVKYLKENFRFHPLVLGELIPPGHRPKVERYKKYLFMTLYYPVYSKRSRETRPQELDIIVTKDDLITSHFQSIPPLKDLFNACNLRPELREKYMSRTAGHLLFYFLSGFWKRCLTKTERIGRRIDEIEREIFKGKEKEMVLEISLVKTDIINFWRIIEHQEEVLESLVSEGEIFFGRGLSHYFADILGTYHQVRNNLEGYKETILALEDTNQSLLSTKINEVMRILTVFSVILLPLTLIASIWGMNVKLPFGGHPNGFWILTITMIVLTGGLIAFFYRKKWL